MSDFDSPWKEALDHFFAAFIAFGVPEADADIDWTRDHDSLEMEMRKLLAESEVGPRRIDKLVRVITKAEGDEALLHVEAQVQPEDGFERRMYVYNYKAEDRYNQPVVSIAILGDDRPDWRPSKYVFERWGCKKTFEFIIVKLLDWRGRETELEEHPNPFALFVLTHLKSLETRDDEEKRAEWKLRIALNFIGRGMSRADLRQWLRLLDWLLDLSSERNRVVAAQIRKSMEEKKMPFVDFIQKYEMEREIETLLFAIESVLDVKFGESGSALVPVLNKQTDPDFLRRFLVAARTATRVEDLPPIPS